MASNWEKAQALRVKLKLCDYGNVELLRARKSIQKRLSWRAQGPKDCNDYRYVLRLTEYAINLEMKARNLAVLEPIRNPDDSINQYATASHKVKCGMSVSQSHYRSIKGKK